MEALRAPKEDAQAAKLGFACLFSFLLYNSPWSPSISPARPALPSSSHRAVLEPVLEVLTPRLGLAHVLAALSGNPLDQDLLQIRVVLLLDLLLHLSAQAVGRSPVRHSEQLW